MIGGLVAGKVLIDDPSESSEESFFIVLNDASVLLGLIGIKTILIILGIASIAAGALGIAFFKVDFKINAVLAVSC